MELEFYKKLKNRAKRFIHFLLNSRLRGKKGFTLVEMVVVIALFAIVINVVVSIFVNVVQHQRRMLKEQEFLNQVSYAEEYMSKAIRMAVKDETGNCIDLGDIYSLTHYNYQASFYQGIKFKAYNGVCQEFFFENGTLKETKNGIIESQNILSGEFTILGVRFVFNGDKWLQEISGWNSIQPRVTILLEISPWNSAGATKLIQTTISQMNLNTDYLSSIQPTTTPTPTPLPPGTGLLAIYKVTSGGGEATMFYYTIWENYVVEGPVGIWTDGNGQYGPMFVPLSSSPQSGGYGIMEGVAPNWTLNSSSTYCDKTYSSFSWGVSTVINSGETTSCYFYNNYSAPTSTPTPTPTPTPLPTCGDGVVDTGEQCDNGLSNGACPAICSVSCAINDCGGGGSGGGGGGAQRGTLNLHKIATGGGPGGRFYYSWVGMGPVPLPFVDTYGDGQFDLPALGVDAGWITVLEYIPSSSSGTWNLESVSCDAQYDTSQGSAHVYVGANTTVNCYFTNNFTPNPEPEPTPIPPTPPPPFCDPTPENPCPPPPATDVVVNVYKNTVGGGSGPYNAPFDYIYSGNGPVGTITTYYDGQWGPLTFGAYSGTIDIQESIPVSPSGVWNFGSVSCNAPYTKYSWGVRIQASANTTVNCYFTNNFTPF